MTDTTNPSADAFRQTAQRLREEASRLDEQVAYLRWEISNVEASARKRRADADHMDQTADWLSTPVAIDVRDMVVSRTVDRYLKSYIDEAVNAALYRPYRAVG
jgi:hypothetical protein